MGGGCGRSGIHWRYKVGEGQGDARRRGGLEEGDEAMGGGDLGEMRGIRGSVSRPYLSLSLSFPLFIFIVYITGF